MATAEELYEQQWNEDRARQEAMAVQDAQRQAQAAGRSEPVTFPWLMLIVAIIFDLISLIPIVNIFSEILAGLILWLWKHSYNSKTNPLVDIVIAKIVDFICLDILPSNTFTVVYAYIKKRTASVAGSKVGGKIVAKLAI
jgi:uncharacterized protein YqgC (DUF456 family)